MNFLMRRLRIRASTRFGHADADGDRQQPRDQRACRT